MPRKRARPPADRVAQELMAALERLQAGSPQNPDLARKAKLGRLKINFSTVAQEAGRSRTLIAYENCRYPRVRAAVQAAMEPVVETRTTADVILRLRQENAELRKALKQSDSVNAALILRLRAIEKTAQRDRSAAERRARRGEHDPLAVAGSGIDLTPLKQVKADKE